MKIQVLEERLRLRRIEKYGPGSEKLSNLQLELLEQEPGVSSQEVAAESEREAPPPVSEAKKKRKHPGRQTLPADLPRVERVIACTPEQCVCGNCGAETKVIGYEVSEVLDVEPARYFVQVTKREKRACKTCPGARRDGCATSRTDHRQEPGVGWSDHRHGGEQILLTTAPISTKCSFIARRGHRHQPGHDVRLGDDHRRDVDAGSWSDAQPVACRHLHPGR